MKPFVAHPNPGSSIKTNSEGLANPGDISAIPTLRLFSESPGVDQLDPALTINGTTAYPSIRYRGGDATALVWPKWEYGATLELQAGTAPSYNQGSPGMGTSDDSVKFNQGGWYQPASSTVGDIGTEDVVFEVVFKTFEFPATIDYVKKRSTAGYQVATLAAGNFTIALDDGPNVGQPLSAALSANTWYHAIAFFDRSGNAQIYINGAASGGAPSIAAVGSISSSDLLMIGNDADGPSQTAYFAMWKSAAWLDTHLQATVASERFAKLTGTWPSKANGTSLPTVASRASEAYIDKLEGSTRKLYQVGDNWMRTVRRQDSASETITGYLSESQGENEVLYSEDLTDASWVKTRATIDANSAVAPDGETTADGLVGTSVSNTHFVGQAMASTAEEHMFSVFLKAGDRDWAYINIPTVANANAYYDLATPAVGTVGAGATAQIEDWGDGWCRCLITYTGGAPSHSHDIYAADADGDNTFTGDDSTVNLYIWGAMHDHATADTGFRSYIKTGGSIVTRVKDQLRYKGDDGNVANVQKGSVAFSVLAADFGTNASKYVFDLSDGGSSADRIYFYITPTGDVAVAGSAATAGNVGSAAGTTDITDGAAHTCSVSYRADELKLFVDGAQEGATDTDCGMPNDLDRIDVGQKLTSVDHANDVISNFRIYSRTGVKK